MIDIVYQSSIIYSERGDNMATVATQIRIDEDTKMEASNLLDGLGMTLSEAVNIFLKQVVLQKCIPFEIKEKTNMGMTEKQFDGFIRFVLDDLIEIKEEKDTGKKEEKLDRVIEILQKTL